jgi:hypothetical protein
MKIFTKEWYKQYEIWSIKYWLTEEEGGIRVLPILDESVPEMPDEIRADATSYLTDKPKQENRMRVVAAKNIFPLYMYYDPKNANGKYRSLENDIKAELINRMRVYEYLPEEIRQQIPDKRLFVMGYAPPKVKMAVLDYLDGLPYIFEDSEQNNLRELKILSELTNCQQRQKEDIYSINYFFRDEAIKEVIIDKNEIKIRLFDESEMILTGGEVIEQEKEMFGAIVTEHELHKNKDKYELHLLLLQRDKNLMEETFYATYSFKDLRLKLNTAAD